MNHTFVIYFTAYGWRTVAYMNAIAPKDRLLVNSKELGRLLGYCERSIDKLRESGLPHYLLSRRAARYSVPEVLDWLRTKRVVRCRKVKDIVGNLGEKALAE